MDWMDRVKQLRVEEIDGDPKKVGRYFVWIHEYKCHCCFHEHDEVVEDIKGQIAIPLGGGWYDREVEDEI
jgi:hypothetical protein